MLRLRGSLSSLVDPLFFSPLTMNLNINLRNACIVRVCVVVVAVVVSVVVVLINHNTWFSLAVCSKIAQLLAYLACLFGVDFQ